MHCHLLDLPIELHLKIIQELRQGKDVEAHADYGQKNDHRHKEKQKEQIEVYHDLINWSCTCSYFRNLLAPDIFKAVKLVNDERSGSSLNAVAKGPHNVHVKNVHFIGSVLDNGHNEAAISDTERILPRSVDALLCELQQFPSLEKLSIKFDKNPMRLNCNMIGQETPKQDLISRNYSALTQNKSPRFKHLEIRQLAVESVSTFSNATFHDLLSHLEQFTISIHSDDFEGKPCLNMTRGYRALAGKLEENFFNHLANVTTLSLKAPRLGPLGLEGWPYVPVTLKANHMPLLTTLHLDCNFVSPDLVNFLVGQKDTLEELTLSHCYASTRVFTDMRSQAKNGIYWSQLFTSLFSARLAQLRRFKLVGCEISPSHEKDFRKDPNEKTRTILRQDPARILFAYAILGNMYGVLFYDKEQISAALLEGEDQRSWDRLMELVETNARLK